MIMNEWLINVIEMIIDEESRRNGGWGLIRRRNRWNYECDDECNDYE